MQALPAPQSTATLHLRAQRSVTAQTSVAEQSVATTQLPAGSTHPPAWQVSGALQSLSPRHSATHVPEGPQSCPSVHSESWVHSAFGISGRSGVEQETARSSSAA